jgi:hypothetical protein
MLCAEKHFTEYAMCSLAGIDVHLPGSGPVDGVGSSLDAMRRIVRRVEGQVQFKE